MIKVSMNGASRALQQATQKALANAESARKQITTEVMGHAIMASPIDTGRFAGNWRLGTGSAPTGTNQESRKTEAGANALAQRRHDSIMSAVAKSKPDETLFLVNNLPYAQRLEYEGHSPQAPGGMIGPAIAILPQIVNAAIRNGGR